MKKVICLLVIIVGSIGCLKAQFVYGTTGLLRMPTADMQRDKTFMAGGNFLHNQATPKHWWYNTGNYYINFTFLPFLEVAYTCTLNKAVDRDYYGNPVNYWVPSTIGKFVNQDRMFSVRLRLIKEGLWWKHMPAVVVGSNDVLSNSWEGGKLTIDNSNYKSNGYWNRYYIAATKHIDLQQVGQIGVHAAYIYNRREDFRYNGVALGTNFQLALPATTFVNKALNGLNLMAEYDSRTINIGMSYSIWKDHINLVGELNQCKYPSAGIYFKVHLK